LGAHRAGRPAGELAGARVLATSGTAHAESAVGADGSFGLRQGRLPDSSPLSAGEARFSGVGAGTWTVWVLCADGREWTATARILPGREFAVVLDSPTGS
jgi:hypothetical protein